MRLAGQVLVFGDAGEGHIRRGVVDDGDRLQPGLVERACARSAASGMAAAEAMVEIFVHRAAVDEVVVRDHVPHLGVVGARQEADVGVIDHALEHAGVALSGMHWKRS
jgi:hypothetical protein